MFRIRIQLHAVELTDFKRLGKLPLVFQMLKYRGLSLRAFEEDAKLSLIILSLVLGLFYLSSVGIIVNFAMF